MILLAYSIRAYMVCVPKVEKLCSIPNKIGKKSRRNHCLHTLANHSGPTGLTGLGSFSKLISNRVLCGLWRGIIIKPASRGSARSSWTLTVPRNCAVGKSHKTMLAMPKTSPKDDQIWVSSLYQASPFPRRVYDTMQKRSTSRAMGTRL